MNPRGSSAIAGARHAAHELLAQTGFQPQTFVSPVHRPEFVLRGDPKVLVLVLDVAETQHAAQRLSVGAVVGIEAVDAGPEAKRLGQWPLPVEPFGLEQIAGAGGNELVSGESMSTAFTGCAGLCFVRPVLCSVDSPFWTKDFAVARAVQGHPLHRSRASVQRGPQAHPLPIRAVCRGALGGGDGGESKRKQSTENSGPQRHRGMP